MIQTRSGLPPGWNERVKEENPSINLPAGVEFYSTPGHGFLAVRLSLHTAKVSSYDYQLGDLVLLEEDCSAPMWLAEHGIIPMKDYIQSMINNTPRREAERRS